MSVPAGRFYEIYVAVGLHFKPGKYDYFQYNGTVKNCTAESFLKRKDKYFFQRIASKCSTENEAVGVCVSNMMAGKTYIRSYTMEEYHKWLSYNDALTYRYKAELKKYKEHISMRDTGSAIDTLVEMILSSQLTIEFLILFNQMLGNNYVYQKLDGSGNFLWNSELKTKVNSYQPFVLRLWDITPDKVTLLQKSSK